MNRKLDRFLLGTLWICCIILGACFWFNMRFGFNILSVRHWNYLASAQLGPTSIMPSFYISMIVWAAAAIGGLYLIVRPRFRKIKLQSVPLSPPPVLPSIMQTVDAPTKTAAMPASAAKRLQRPVAPDFGLVRMQRDSSVAYPVATIATPVAENKETLDRARDPELESFILDAAKSAGFMIKKPPKIGTNTPSLYAIGMDEVLMIGIACPIKGTATAKEGGDSKWKDDNGEFESPVWKVAQMVDRLNSLFSETLDEDLRITIRPFVVTDGGQITNIDTMRPIWDAFGVALFDGRQSFADYITANPAPPVPGSEKENFDAYSEYIDTVSDYFNSEA